MERKLAAEVKRLNKIVTDAAKHATKLAERGSVLLRKREVEQKQREDELKLRHILIDKITAAQLHVQNLVRRLKDDEKKQHRRK